MLDFNRLSGFFDKMKTKHKANKFAIRDKPSHRKEKVTVRPPTQLRWPDFWSWVMDKATEVQSQAKLGISSFVPGGEKKGTVINHKREQWINLSKETVYSKNQYICLPPKSIQSASVVDREFPDATTLPLSLKHIGDMLALLDDFIAGSQRERGV
ncbi:hypothetical protein BDQ17DRAFT_1378637 [Cyathus striatus]|nr:hypothetical protein BDQ17DRAFT_1378637 [Cyathus striatus]